MPHIIIEHSADLNANELISSAFEAAVESQLFTQSDIQVRAISYAASIPKQFVHVQARIWHGRDEEQKLRLSNFIGERIKAVVELSLPITVEVVDIDKVTYYKI